eukprot:jgi/Mesen1/2388/ME000157S01525
MAQCLGSPSIAASLYAYSAARQSPSVLSLANPKSACSLASSSHISRLPPCELAGRYSSSRHCSSSQRKGSVRSANADKTGLVKALSRPDPSSQDEADGFSNVAAHREETSSHLGQSFSPAASVDAMVVPRRSVLTTAATSAACVAYAATGPVAEALAGSEDTPPALEGSQSGADLQLPACPEGSTVRLSILGKCGLGVSVYPDFVYNPMGGGGEGTATDVGDGRIFIKFDPRTVKIPAVEGSTTTLLGVPLPPPIRIDILPERLEGFIERATGKVELVFQAKFFFSTGPLYRAPPLLVDTLLTTEHSQGVTRSAQGHRLDPQGACKIVGTARVPPVDDAFLTNFLMLPADVLAALPARFELIPAPAGAAAPPAPDPPQEVLELALARGQFDLYHKLLV